MLAHLYGTPAKMDEILSICNKHGAILIEDAAEALSATYKGRKILYPFYTIKRWFSLLKKGRLKDSMQETKYLSSDKAKSIADLLKQSGLN